MRAPILFASLLVVTACASAPPVPVVIEVPAAPVSAPEPARSDSLLPDHPALLASLDVAALEAKISAALGDAGPLGLLAIERTIPLLGGAVDIVGLPGVLALDTARPVTLAVLGPTAGEGRVAEALLELSQVTAIEEAYAPAPYPSVRGRLLLPSLRLAVTQREVQALLARRGFTEERPSPGADVRLASPGRRVIVELTRGASVLTVDAVLVSPGAPAAPDRVSVDAGLETLRAAPPGSPPPPLAGRTLRVEYEPPALATLSLVTRAREQDLVDAFGPAGALAMAREAVLLGGSAAAPYFERVTLEDDPRPGARAVRITVHPGSGHRANVAGLAASIRLPLPGEAESLDVDRAFLDGLSLPAGSLEVLSHWVGDVGAAGWAVALPALLPLLANDRLDVGPVVWRRHGASFERVGATSNEAMPGAVFHGLLPAGMPLEWAECVLTGMSFSPSRPPRCASPKERLPLGVITRLVTTTYATNLERATDPSSTHPPAVATPVIAFARLVKVGDRFVVLAAHDRTYLERAPAPTLAEAPRPAARAETTWATLADLAGLSLPIALPGKVTVTATDEGSRVVFRVGATGGPAVVDP